MSGSPASRQVEALAQPRFDPAPGSVDGVASLEGQQQEPPEGQQAGLAGQQALRRPSHIHHHSSAYVFNPPPEAEAGPGTDAAAEDASQSTVLSKLKKWVSAAKHTTGAADFFGVRGEVRGGERTSKAGCRGELGSLDEGRA